MDDEPNRNKFPEPTAYTVAGEAISLSPAITVVAEHVAFPEAERIGPRSTQANLDEIATREFLTAKQWPEGMINFLIRSVTKSPYRFFLCDDSGSMATNDGHRLVGSGEGTKILTCTRWAELTESLKFHASLVNILQVPTEFRLLNSSRPLVIGGPDPDTFNQFMEALDDSPGGGTPLCRHIRELIDQIQLLEPHLRATGQKAVIIIATDGKSSDGNITEAMAPLQHLPVWVVVRLCTDDRQIVNYWNNVDGELEINIDVLDDFVSEAAEVNQYNPWLTYGEPLHRLREFGVYCKEIDLVDESVLSADQMRTLCSILFNIPQSAIPHPQVDQVF